MTQSADLQEVVDRWAAAELAGDAASLDALLHPEFLFAGPFGYLRTRQEWLDRFTPGDPYLTEFTSFTFTADRPARILADTALIIGTQQSAGIHQGERFDGRYRATLVLIHDWDWLIAGMHLSLREPPDPA